MGNNRYYIIAFALVVALGAVGVVWLSSSQAWRLGTVEPTAPSTQRPSDATVQNDSATARSSTSTWSAEESGVASEGSGIEAAVSDGDAVEIDREASLVIRVREERTGQLLDNVFLWLTHDVEQQRVLRESTGRDGVANFEDVALGTYQVSARLAGAPPISLGHVTAGELGVNEFDLMYPRLPQTTLRLLDPNEKPISRARLLIAFDSRRGWWGSDEPEERFHEEVVTNADGTFEAAHAEGRSRLVIYALDQMLLSRSREEGWAPQVRVEIDAEEESSDIYGNKNVRTVNVIVKGEPELEEGMQSSGLVMNGSGPPRRFEPLGDGFEFLGIPGQSFTIFAGRNSRYSRTIDHRADMVVSENRNENTVVFEYGELLQVAGSVSLPDGTPVPDVELDVVGMVSVGDNERPGVSRTGETSETDDRGQFTVGLAEAPIYQFSIDRRSLDEVPDEFQLAFPVIVSWDQLQRGERVDIVLDPVPRIRGVVVDEHDRPIRSAEVRALSEQGLRSVSPVVRTDRDGFFDLPVRLSTNAGPWGGRGRGGDDDDSEVFVVATDRDGRFGLARSAEIQPLELRIQTYETVRVDLEVAPFERNLSLVWEFSDGGETIWSGGSRDLDEFGIEVSGVDDGRLHVENLPLGLSVLNVYRREMPQNRGDWRNFRRGGRSRGELVKSVRIEYPGYIPIPIEPPDENTPNQPAQ